MARKSIRDLSLRRRGVPKSIRQINTDLQKGEAGRAVPTPLPGTTQKTEAYGRTEIYTYFTRADGMTRDFYAAPHWITVKLLLETAGPVSVSTRHKVDPVLSGRGILLQTGVEYEFKLNRGDRLFIAATAVNRVQFTAEPIPWQQSILETSKQLLMRFTGGR